MKKKEYITPAVLSYEFLIELGFAGSNAPTQAQFDTQMVEDNSHTERLIYSEFDYTLY